VRPSGAASHLDLFEQWTQLERLRVELAAGIRVLTKPHADRTLPTTVRAEAERTWASRRVPQHLELAITSSVAFWVTASMLAAWSRWRNTPRVAAGPDGRIRCFWATGPVLMYHDAEHGTAPRTDRELLERLSLEILGRGRSWDRRDVVRGIFRGFVPGTVATLKAEDLVAAAARLPRGGPAVTDPALFGLVIDNARRLQEFWERQPAGARPEGETTALLPDWQARAQDNPLALIAHVRGFFSLPRTLPVGTFLQSVGLLPGAHFPGCFRADQG